MRDPEYVTATRDVYDHSAAHYANTVGTTVSSKFERPIDRSMLDAFVEEVLSGGEGQVLDIGCGTGRVTSYLYDRGLDVRGVDLSLGMIAIAKSSHPHLRFDVGSLTDLPVRDGSLGGAVLWYSIIHTPLSELSAAWNELARVLVPNGLALLGFQAGNNEVEHRSNAYGSLATLTWYRHSVDAVVRSLDRAGFDVRAQIWRKAEPDHETTPQAFLMVRLK